MDIELSSGVKIKTVMKRLDVIAGEKKLVVIKSLEADA
jgi:hypothetical protein